MKKIKDLAYYLALPYTTLLRRDEAGDVIARIDELPGCIAHGKDEQEALSNLAGMKRLWLEDSIEAGDVIPEPAVEENLPSGKWVQRVPRSLHRKLARLAKDEGVSLNQFVTSLLSEQLGTRTTRQTVEQILLKYFPFTEQQPTQPWDRSVLETSIFPVVEHLDISSFWASPRASKLMPTFETKMENVNESEADCFFPSRRQ
jgi:antitoxin HicB